MGSIMGKPATNYRIKWVSTLRMWVVFDGPFILGRSPDCGTAIDVVLAPLRILQQARAN